MVFPLSDDNSDRRIVPLVNYSIIAANVLVFVVFQVFGSNDEFTYRFSTVPRAIVTGKYLPSDELPIHDQGAGHMSRVPRQEPPPISVYVTLLTSTFLHAHILHLLGNMWFLYVFGDNIEDDVGHAVYLAFYLVTGIVASLCHVAVNANGPFSGVPTLGASGAISGVMGAYLVLDAKRQVKVLVWRFVGYAPGYMAVGLWFVIQLVSGLGLFGDDQHVAYAAHIGGFTAGAILAAVYADFRHRRETTCTQVTRHGATQPGAKR